MAKAADKIIVALDVATKEKALELVEQLRGEISFFKIGLQLYTAEGPEIVRAVLATGAKVWLDLKLYDIPNHPRVLGKKVSAHGAVPAQSGTQPAAGTPALLDLALPALDALPCDAAAALGGAARPGAGGIAGRRGDDSHRQRPLLRHGPRPPLGSHKKSMGRNRSWSR